MNEENILRALQQIKILAEESIATLRRGLKSNSPALRNIPTSTKARTQTIDFDKPLRPFIKSYAKGLSGPKKFTLLLAWLTKGDLKKEVMLAEIKGQWNRMKSKVLLGMKFNGFFAADAKNQDWVELKKKGVYVLRPSWQQSLKG